MDKIKDIIKNNIIMYIAKSNYNKKELAAILGISAPAITKWTTGASLPSVDLLPLLCETLKVSMDQLLGINDEFNLSSDEIELINSYRSLSSDGKVILLNLAKLKQVK